METYIIIKKQELSDISDWKILFAFDNLDKAITVLEALDNTECFIYTIKKVAQFDGFMHPRKVIKLHSED